MTYIEKPESGIIPLALLGIGFLAISLIGVTAVASNPNIKTSIQSWAKTKTCEDLGGPKARQKCRLAAGTSTTGKKEDTIYAPILPKPGGQAADTSGSTPVVGSTGAGAAGGLAASAGNAGDPRLQNLNSLKQQLGTDNVPTDIPLMDILQNPSLPTIANPPATGKVPTQGSGTKGTAGITGTANLGTTPTSGGGQGIAGSAGGATGVGKAVGGINRQTGTNPVPPTGFIPTIINDVKKLIPTNVGIGDGPVSVGIGNPSGGVKLPSEAPKLPGPNGAPEPGRTSGIQSPTIINRIIDAIVPSSGSNVAKPGVADTNWATTKNYTGTADLNKGGLPIYNANLQQIAGKNPSTTPLNYTLYATEQSAAATPGQTQNFENTYSYISQDAHANPQLPSVIVKDINPKTETLTYYQTDSQGYVTNSWVVKNDFNYTNSNGAPQYNTVYNPVSTFISNVTIKANLFMDNILGVKIIPPVDIPQTTFTH